MTEQKLKCSECETDLDRLLADRGRHVLCGEPMRICGSVVWWPDVRHRQLMAGQIDISAAES